MQTDDDYGIYRRPSAATLTAVVCAGAALFFGAWSMQLKKSLSEELGQLEQKNARAVKSLEEKDRALYALNNQVRDLQSEIRALRLRPEMAAAPAAPAAVIPAAPAAPETARAAVTAPTPATPAQAEPAAPARAPETEPQAAAEKAEASARALEEADALSGEILTYSPDSRRVYLSLGSANGGVRQGNRFSVWRGGEYVTDIEVMKVFSVTSTCKVTGDAAGLQVGDIAKRARPALGVK